VTEINNVVAQFAEQQSLACRVRTAGENSDRLISYLPAVTVRTVKYVVTPSFAYARDVRELVDHSGGYQEPTRL
jgi:hypothetical protein